jgi:hypothetical protein
MRQSDNRLGLRPVARQRTDVAALPGWIAPQLTQLVEAAPDGGQWLHEIKYDGYRMHTRVDRGAVKLLTRTGLDWTHKYPAIAKALAALEPNPSEMPSPSSRTTSYQDAGADARRARCASCAPLSRP